MAQLNRNVNLEEIDSDVLFGIDALRNQTGLQKVVFFGSVIVGVLVNVLLPLYFETPRIICILLFLFLLLIGVGVGCNYSEDMSYGKYLYLFLFKPSKPLSFASTEDVDVIRKRAEEVKKEEEELIRRKGMENSKEQKRMLIKVIAIVVVIALVIGGIFIFKASRDQMNTHHRVEEVMEGTNEQR